MDIQARLAVCSWSLKSADPDRLIQDLKATGINRLQVALEPLRAQPQLWNAFPEQCRQNGIQIVAGMFTTIGEDYTTMETIRQTGGVVPDHSWEENLRRITANAEIAAGIH